MATALFLMKKKQNNLLPNISSMKKNRVLEVLEDHGAAT